MSSTTASSTKPVDAPDPMVLDIDHLRGQTLGDEPLEADLLTLFSQQALSIVRDLRANGQDAGAASPRLEGLLHLLCGSARTIGAWEVARHAQMMEEEVRGAATPPPPSTAGMLALASAVERACQAIERRGVATPSRIRCA